MDAGTKKNQIPEPGNSLPTIFAGAFGIVLGLALLKFGNPIIFERFVTTPTNIFEWVFNSWPIVFGYGMLAALVILGIAVARWPAGLPKALYILPLIWFGWEVVAGTQSHVERFSTPTVIHFGLCVVCFFLGLISLGGVQRLGFFWLALIAAFFIVSLTGLQQHFGGLTESRKYWLAYIYPTLKEVPPGFIQKMNSTRIFSTLFYPNTLAEAILLLLPALVAAIWSAKKRFTRGARGLLIGLISMGGLACLFWSGSKGGWLLMLVLVVVGVLFLPVKRELKVFFVIGVLGLGLAGFTVKYLIFFKRGAPSVVARFDYWRAAGQTFRDNPVFGNGPGTFGKAYEARKKPGSEMAQLAHNDYLQQASDSGLIGFLAYAGWVIGTLIYTGLKARLQDDWVRLGVWLGLLGWALQSFVEFGLYIPAISWTAFALMGWLLAQTGNGIDSQPAIR